MEKEKDIEMGFDGAPNSPGSRPTTPPTTVPVDHQAQIDALSAQLANLQQNVAANKATDNVQAQ